MVNERPVRILLECILVMTYFYRARGGHVPPRPAPRSDTGSNITHVILLFLSEMVREATEVEGDVSTHHMIARYQTANKKSTQV